jgi:hypothetical protein
LPSLSDGYAIFDTPQGVAHLQLADDPSGQPGPDPRELDKRGVTNGFR